MSDDPTAHYRPWLLAYSVVCAGGAVLHGSWHWVAPRLPELAGLTEVQRDAFVVLNGSIVLVLASFAALGLCVARSSFTLAQARAVVAVMFAFWLGRLLLELAFPVRVPLLGERTSLAIAGLLVLVLSLLAAPELVAWRRARGSSSA